MSLREKVEKQSVNAKKTKASKLKTILASPFPRYWPEISATDCDDLRKKFQELFGDTAKKSWSEQGIHLGLGSCMRSLTRNEISCLLLSANIRPNFIATEIIFCAISKNTGISVLCIPDLANLTEKLFKVSSLSVAIAKEKQPRLEEWIKNKAQNFPISEKMALYYGIMKLTDHSSMETAAKSMGKRTASKDEDMIDMSKLHLKRPSKTTRAFVPKTVHRARELEKNAGEGSDFISFSSTRISKAIEIDEDEPEKIDSASLKELVHAAMERKRNSRNYLEPSPYEVSVGDDNYDDSSALPTANKITQKQNRKRKKKCNKDSNNSNISSYLPLKVLKIQPNPNKGKKRNKKI